MNITPVVLNSKIVSTDFEQKPVFGHSSTFLQSDYSKKQKAIVAGTTALGVATSLAIMAKRANYSLKPSRMFSDLKYSYLNKVDFHLKEIVAMGIGTCLGGLAGGYIIDKNPQNRKAKRREAIMQIGNISIPIATVAGFNKLGKPYGKIAQAGAGVAGILVGVYLANYLMNKLSNIVFKEKNGERGVQATDFSAHLDDVMASASYIAPESRIVHAVSRLVPFALMIAGNEVGNKKA